MNNNGKASDELKNAYVAVKEKFNDFIMTAAKETNNPIVTSAMVLELLAECSHYFVTMNNKLMARLVIIEKQKKG